ncbi:hypothetical protein HMN09_01310700 [Mycena chlorophos]|uniref:Transmembrane protein n=1 Tax=Mycena chlorophos TaxID=658473 RepID=A0A8H6VS65_MYCCL|nr:hypothetical protein HMN09_01310700 [Mycena chlorophos]
MKYGSPSAYLLWALLAVAFFIFMLIHIWFYDKFKCLRWDSGRQPGAFKRVMTYSYFATVPLLMVFGVATAALKYQEGSILFEGSILPRPLSIWAPSHLRWVLPLYFVLSIAWALEIVTHLEELTFWVFLLNQGPKKREWFSSWEFRAWYIGSMIAILGMPITALLKRHDIETTDAWIFAAGSSAGTFTTVCFLYVLWNFPRFIRSVKAEGAVPDVVVRLATFYHLNCIRVVFRFLFTVPLLTLALDGLTDQKHFYVVNSPFWSDIFLMTGGIGCFISSAITMLIFFPRSMTSEAGYKAHVVSQNSKGRAAATTPLPDYERQDSPIPSPKSLHSFSRSPPPQSTSPPPMSDGETPLQHYQQYQYQSSNSHVRPPSGVARSTSDDATLWDAGSRKPTASTSTSVRYPHPAGTGSASGSGNAVMVDGMPVYFEEGAPPYRNVHHYAMTFTSPIDLPVDPGAEDHS